MGFSLDISVPAITVFLQGILSFFSPCVLPLLPVYMGYLADGAAGGAGPAENTGAVGGTDLASGTDTAGGTGPENGTGPAGNTGAAADGGRRGRTMVNTFCFVLGVSFAIFLLGLGFTAAGQFLRGHLRLLSRLGGILIVLLGLYQLGLFGHWMPLERERRLPFRMDRAAASPLTALALGFVFSFAWTPCVGPALASVLLLAASAAARTRGFLLIGLYTLGFALPFLGLGLFTDALLDLVRKHRNAARYAAKAGGTVLLAVGVMLLTGWMDGAAPAGSVKPVLPDTAAGTAEPSTTEETVDTAEQSATEETEDTAGLSGTEEPSVSTEADTESADTSENPDTAENPDAYPAPDFSLPDQYGVLHSLSDYRGKVVFLNFWATWCPPCRAEMPDIQSLYEDYEAAGDDAEVVILGVAAPGVGGEEDTDGVTAFLSENGYSYPVVMDTSGDLLAFYGISAFPTTFMIDRAGNIYGYVEGSLPRDVMEDIIQQTLEGGRN